MLRSLLLTSSLVGFVWFSTAQADVYKYKDEKGNVLYTDKPLYLPAERLSIKTEGSSIVDLSAEKEQAELAERDAARRQASATAAEQRKAKQTVAEGKAEACNKARQDYLARMNAQRLYEEQPNGERRYLTDKELDAARAAAKQAMDALCN